MRTVLFTPGTRPERIQKALESGAASVVVADLEDAVAPADKIEARIAVRNALLAVPQSKSVRAVRINGWPSQLAEDDLEVVLDANPDLLVVPKAEDPDAMRALQARAGNIPLLLIIESAAGVLAAQSLATLDGVQALAFGAEDLAADAGMRRSVDNTEVAVPRSLVALAAAAAGKQAIDMITADFKDEARTRREALEARGLGYAGKMCLHPAQVAVVAAAFAPTADEVAWADKVLAAVDDAGAADGGLLVVDGKMIDGPLIEQARRIAQDTHPKP